MSKIGMVEVKQLLQYNLAFRKLFPEYSDEINKFSKCTSCKNYGDLLKKVLGHKDRIDNFIAGNEVITKNTFKDEFKVINTGIDSLEEALKNIPIGSKIESLARSGTEVTAVIRIPRF